MPHPFLLLIAIVWGTGNDGPPQDKAIGPMRNIARIHYTRAHVLGGCGIQLADRWVLVAKHEVKIWKPGMLQVRVGENHIAVKRILQHPDERVDLALLELAKPTPLLERITLFSAEPAEQSRLWLGGFGKAGPAGKAGRASTFAAGYNRLEVIESNRGKVVLDKNVPDEVLPARFDSGSPVFIRVGENWQLLGITVTASNSKNPNFGDRSHHQLLAPAREWLDKHIPSLGWSR
jgi:hypothetical protein